MVTLEVIAVSPFAMETSLSRQKSPGLLHWIAPLVALLLLIGLPISAQVASGTLEGRVTDADGAVLPGVTLTATHSETGISRVVTTGADGGYRIASLPVGTYSLTAELSGFGKYVQ